MPTSTLYFYSEFQSIQMRLAACFWCSRWKHPFIGTARGLLDGLATVIIIFARFGPVIPEHRSVCTTHEPN